MGRGRQSNSFTVAVTARDDHGATSNTVGITITLDDVDDPPTVFISPTRPPVAGEQLTFILVDSDAITNTYTTQWSHSDDGITFTDFANPDGFAYTLGLSARGSYRITTTYNEHNRRGLNNSHETLVYVHTWAAIGGPGLPRNLRALPGDRQVTLSWDPPARSAEDSRNDPAITDYVITFQYENFDPFTFDDGVGSGTTVIVKPARSANPTTSLFNTLSYTFTVAARTAAGLGQSVSIMATPTGILDPVPSIMIEHDAGASARGPFTVTIIFSEAVTGFEIGDVRVSRGARKSGFSGSGATYRLTITPPANLGGTISINVEANVAMDATGNSNQRAPGINVPFSTRGIPNTTTISVPRTLALEEGANATLTVTASSAAGADTTVAYTVTAGTAEAVDYAVTGTRVTIPMGQTMVGIPVRAVQDGLFERAETFTIRLDSVTSATNDVERSSSAFTTTVTIAEDADDAISVSLAGDATVPEGGTATWTVSLTGGTSTANVVVPYTITGTATRGRDYTAPGSSAVTIDAGQASGMIEIATADDGPGDSGETLIVTLGVPTGGGGPAGSLTVDSAARTITTTILDGVCTRTEQVRDWIVAQVLEADNCGLVTDEHLAAIEGAMDLNSKGITALRSGDFQGLTLSDLTLRNNRLTMLPAGVFDGLTLSGGLNLQGNLRAGAKFSLTVELEPAATPATVRLALVEGIPRAITVPVTVAEGTPSSNQASFAVGATTSDTFTVTRSGPGITIVSIGNLPALPDNYIGLQLNSGDPLVLFADVYFTGGDRNLADAKLLYYALLPELNDNARTAALDSVASEVSDELQDMLMAVDALVREDSGDLDFNGDNRLNAQDAAIFYYALALPVSLGDGTRNSGFPAIREAILGPFMSSGEYLDQDLQNILRTINGL